jgi:hypothetical protein
MGYYIDLTSISIESFKAKLETGFLLPGRMILKEKINERFSVLTKYGITNVSELQKLLKMKDKMAIITKSDGQFEEYLTILLREINSIQPKPNKIKDFVGISSETVLKLEKEGVKDTFGLFDRVKSSGSRKELASRTGISEEEILELTKLTDLSRIKWVGNMFARVLYESGFDTVEKVSTANYKELYQRITLINEQQNLYRGKIGLNDLKLCVNAAQDVPLEIEY